jgi:hypothetical protein
MRPVPPLLAALAVLLVAVPAPAAAAPGTMPRTLARTAVHPDGPVRLGFDADVVGVRWEGRAHGLALRLRRDGRWGAWRALHRGDVRPVGGHASGLVAAGGARAYELRVPAGVRAVRATAINTTDGPRSRARGAREVRSVPGLGRVCILSRAAWGADESVRFDAAGAERWVPAYFPVQRLTLHHTADELLGAPVPAVDAAARVRAILHYHAITLGFGDIGYHLLVDDEGCLYEGRHSGPDGVPVLGPPAPDGTPQAVNAGHVAGFNAGNVGVAVLGNFTAEEPTRPALRAAGLAFGVLAAVTGLDVHGHGPYGAPAPYMNPITGATKEVATISAHRDWLATECPGERLLERLPRVRRLAERVVRLLPQER